MEEVARAAPAVGRRARAVVTARAAIRVGWAEARVAAH